MSVSFSRRILGRFTAMSKSSRSFASSSTSRSEWNSSVFDGEDSVRVKDRQRAAVCCVAVYQEAEAARRTFAQYSDLNFGKVILGPGPCSNKQQRSRILVATAYDFQNNSSSLTVYVAFSGKGSIAVETVFDAADSQLRIPFDGPDGKPIAMRGHIHNGFYKALVEELPDPMELMVYCAGLIPESQVDRMIFCGHGVGGTLSHVSMLNLLFTTFVNNTDELRKSDNTFLSIAFGAPLFLDEEARDYFSHRGELPLESRFITYINDEDPVPLMLNNLSAYPAPPDVQNLHKKLNLKFQTLLEVAGKVPAIVHTGEEFHRSRSSALRNSIMRLNIPPALRQLEETDTDMRRLRQKQPQRGRGYAAFGQFWRFSDRGMQYPVQQSGLDSWKLSWTRDSVKYHAMGYYAYNVLLVEPSQVPVPSIEEGSPPKIDEAFITILSGQQRGEVHKVRLEVVGYNLLLCLKKRCAVSEFPDKWEITRVKQNSIEFRNKKPLKETELSVLANQMTKVKVETMFGVSDWIQVGRKESGADSHVIQGLKHVIGKLVILESVQGRGPGHPSYASTKKFRQHLQIVAKTTHAFAEHSLKKFYLSLENPERLVIEKRNDANDFIKQVSDHLNQITVRIKRPPIIGEGDTRKYLVRKGLGGLGLSMFSVGFGVTLYMALAIIASVSTMGIAIPIAAGGLVIGIAALALSHRKELKFDDYEQIVQFIYSQLSPDEPLLTGDKNVADYERAITEKAKKISVLVPNTWIQHLQEQLRHQSRETGKIVVDLVQLMLVIDESVILAKQQKVLAVIGPENVGKSTLINILRNGPPSEEEEYTSDNEETEEDEPDAASTGFTIHTYDPKGYLASAVAVGDLVAVDFPGMGAAHERKELSTMWEAFERLPDLCVVVMKFNGDVTSQCADVPKEVRKILCDKVVLMVNHVDGIMKGKRSARVWKQFSPAKVEELCQDFIRNSDNMLDSVMLTSLSRDLYDHERELLAERGILFAKDVLDHIRRLVYSSKF